MKRKFYLCTTAHNHVNTKFSFHFFYVIANNKKTKLKRNNFFKLCYFFPISLTFLAFTVLALWKKIKLRSNSRALFNNVQTQNKSVFDLVQCKRMTLWNMKNSHYFHNLNSFMFKLHIHPMNPCYTYILKLWVLPTSLKIFNNSKQFEWNWIAIWETIWVISTYLFSFINWILWIFLQITQLFGIFIEWIKTIWWPIWSELWLGIISGFCT